MADDLRIAALVLMSGEHDELLGARRQSLGTAQAPLSTAIAISPVAVMGFPRGRPWEVPGDGHGFSPRTVVALPAGFRRGASLLCRRGRRRGGLIRLR